jgi:hypothetical protein
MVFDKIFSKKTQKDKHFPKREATSIVILPMVQGVTKADLPHPVYLFPREHLSLLDYEAPDNTTGIHVSYDGVATDSEWEELMRQSFKSAVQFGTSLVKVVSEPALTLELVPLEEMGAFDHLPVKRGRYEN